MMSVAFRVSAVLPFFFLLFACYSRYRLAFSFNCIYLSCLHIPLSFFFRLAKGPGEDGKVSFTSYIRKSQRKPEVEGEPATSTATAIAPAAVVE